MKYPLVLWILIVVLESIRHLYLIKSKHVSPRKWLSLLIRTTIAAGFIYYELKLGIRDWYVIYLVYFITGWFIHDTILALALKGKPWYLNSTGVIDKLQGGGSPYIWVMKLIAFLTLVGMYFVNYRV